MTRSTALLVVLSVMGAAHFGCSASPDTAASPMDANNPPDAAVIDNDQQSVTPDVPVTPDSPTPPPVDVPATPDTMMAEGMDAVGGQLNRFSWQIAGTSVCDSITYVDGEIHLGTELRIGLMATSSNGDCTTSPMSCACPAGGGPGATILRGLTSTMMEFEAITGGATYRLVAMTRCR